MSPTDQERFKEIFLREARRLVATMNAALLKMEKSPGSPEPAGKMFQAIHTLKGIADAEGHQEMTQLCHAIEDVLDAIRKKKLHPESCTDLLFHCCDFLESGLKSIQDNNQEQPMGAVIAQLKTLLGDAPQAKAGSPIPETPAAQDAPETLGKIQAIEVKVETLDALMNLAEELLVSKMKFDGLKDAVGLPEMTEAVDTLGRLIEEMQFRVTQARMVPIGAVFNRFPRMVRDLAKDQKKEVDFIVSGHDIELDRAVIDEIGESLLHLLRNAVDHGLETAEVRKQAGKPPAGTLRVTASGTKEFAVIEMQDDGAGLDLDQIKQAGIKKGRLTASATQKEVMDSIFAGVSTTKEVTKVSGRGLGLGIVKKTIESLGGTVLVESTPKKGTKFTMRIPLTMAIIKAIFVKVGGKTYAIPLANVERMIKVEPSDIKGTLDIEAIVLDGQDIPITRLNMLFHSSAEYSSSQILVIVSRGNEKLGLLVDDLVSTQEIVIKPLNRVMRDNKYFAGSAIIGSGEAILVLDVANLTVSRREAAHAN